MKRWLVVWLSAVLIAALLCPVAMMEDALNVPPAVSEEVVASDSVEAMAEPVEETDEPAEGSVTPAPFDGNTPVISSAEDTALDVEEGDEPGHLEESVPTDSAEPALDIEPVDDAVSEIGFDADGVYFESETDEIVDFVSNEAANAMLAASGDEIDINSNFPDTVFRAYVVSECDRDKNGLLSAEERLGVTEVYISGYGKTDSSKVRDLTGIKLFPNLKELTVYGNSLTTLDVSGCTNLTKLLCDHNQLTSLNVSGCTNLTKLVCHNNQLTSLNVSGCTNLTELWCDDNQLTSLNVSGCTNLTDLRCNRNQLTSLDVSSSALQRLECARNQLTTLKVQNCNNLKTLWCDYNNIQSLDVGTCQNLRDIACGKNQLTSLTVYNPYYLSCFCNQLTSLDINSCSNLLYLSCYNNQINTLDISGCPTLLSFVNEENKYDEIASDGLMDYPIFEYLPEDCDEFPQVLRIDKNVSIITEKTIPVPSPTPVPTSKPTEVETTPAAPAAPAAPDPAPASAPSIPIISAIKKAGKTTVTAGPGTVYQLDLGGKAGKKFKSSKKKVATVDQNGLVTVKAAGKTKITFKVGKKKRTVTLKVIDPTVPTSIALGVETTAVKKGDVVTIAATLPEGTTSGIKWKSSNKKIATVSNGVVTFKKPGKVTITATTVRGKKKAKVKFSVSK